MISTPRLQLRCWTPADQDVFASMHADPEVMHDYGGPISRHESDAKLDRYMAPYRNDGFARWAVETGAGDFSAMPVSRHVGRTIRSACTPKSMPQRQREPRWMTSSLALGWIR
jgi:RimJ/RimL family protein N-acetyltransferase